MNLFKMFFQKNQPQDMEETYSKSDREIKSLNFQNQIISKIRESVHWKVALNKQLLLNQQYILYELIQSTKTFDLYRAINIKNKERVIVKILDKEAIRQNFGNNQVKHISSAEYQQFLRKLKIQNQAEIKLYNRSSGVFLIQCYEIFQNSDCQIKISQNYYEENLQSILKRRNSLPVQEALAIIKNIIFALSELHKEGIILAELNSVNIIYKNGVYRMNDFSSMRKVNEKFTSTLNLNHSYSYGDMIAPELFVCPQIVDMKSQIWALGLLLFEMIGYEIPLENRKNFIIKQAKQHNINFSIKNGQASKQILNLMRQMLEIDPHERISWKKLINHPIFSNQQYFYTIKLMPVVDARNTSLKNKQNDVLPEEIVSVDSRTVIKGDSEQITKIKNLNIQNIFKQAGSKNQIIIQKFLDVESETFHHIRKINLIVMKASYIFSQIIQKIQKFNLLDERRRSQVETVLLISQRCFMYMKKTKILQLHSKDARIDNYLQQLKRLLNKIKDFTRQMEKKIKNIESSPYYLSNDIFSSIIRKNKSIDRSRIVNGKEGLDFSFEQHLNYTQDKCISKFIGEIKELKIDKKSLQDLILNLKFYKAINAINLEDLNQSCSFDEAVQRMINKEMK